LAAVLLALYRSRKGVNVMSAQENKDFIRRYVDSLSGKAKTAASLAPYIAEQELKDHILGFEEACPNYEVVFDRLIAEEDMVSAIGTVRATNTGPLMGMPPTGKSIEIPMHITYRIADGKIVEHWMLVDNFAMMQQLGLIPSAA
jgi:predicted ester cyclase